MKHLKWTYILLGVSTLACGRATDDSGTTQPGIVDCSESEQLTLYADTDGDGYGDPTSPVLACFELEGFSRNALDCNDEESGDHPGAWDSCDGRDNNCDGQIDEDVADHKLFYPDTDGDGVGSNAGGAISACEAPDGFVETTGDCNDLSAAVFASAEEVCDGLDNDCDGVVDGPQAVGARTWFRDADRDGVGIASDMIAACSQPEGYAAESGDCDDEDPSTYPGAPEQCDDVDNDCDGETDDNVVERPWYADVDGDSFGDPNVVAFGCLQPEDYAAIDGDCNDNSAAVVVPSWYADADMDGYGASDTEVVQCNAPDGYVATAGDCADDDPTRNPGEAEMCDGVDSNCDGLVDDGIHVPSSHPTIDAATLAATENNLLVCVEAGTFSGTLDLSNGGRLIGAGQDVTIIDAVDASLAISVTDPTGPVELRDFTVTNADGRDGAGIQLRNVADGLIENVSSSGHTATAATDDCSGLGLRVWDSNVTLRNVDLSNNIANCEVTLGVGAMFRRSTIVMENVSFTGNQGLTSNWGEGTAFTSRDSQVIARNLLVTDNRSETTDGDSSLYGGAITFSFTSLGTHRLENATIANNFSAVGTGIERGAGIMFWDSGAGNLELVNVDLSFNTATGDDIRSTGVTNWTGDGRVVMDRVNFFGNTQDMDFAGTTAPAPETLLVVDPMYTDAPGGDYTLGLGSGLIDSGSGDLVDPDSSPSDVGAYGGLGSANW